MKCSKCGTELKPNAKFCGKCGNKITDQVNESITNKPVQPVTTQHPNNYTPVQYDNIYSNNSQYTIPNNNYGSNRNYSTTKKKSKTSPILVAIISILLVFILFLVFNILIVAKVIDTSSSDALDGYKDSLFEMLNISEDKEKDSKYDDNKKSEDKTKKDKTTEKETTLPTEPYTSSTNSNDFLPAELQQYSNGLLYEGRMYRITLQKSDWYLNYRSTPIYNDINNPGGNVVGKLKHGTEIYVEYIYNGTWAVFQKNGKYVFASIYDDNNPSKDILMQVS